MNFSQDTINQIHSRVAIEEVVGDFVSLKKKGQNMWACCPFHNEKSPSFSVSPSKGIYKCFGCGKSGDAIQFIMDIEGSTFGESIKYLAEKYGIEIEDEPQSDEQIRHQNEKESLYIVSNFAQEYFSSNLLNHAQGRSIGLSYFKERGFTQNIIEKFDLGYSLEAWDGLLEEAKKRGHSLDLLEKAGLIIRKENKTYDRFRNRVIFPIHNISGKAIAFGARILTSSKKQPKYLNSPETAIYHKSNILYGIYQAKQAIRQKDNCYLVEGYTDVISMHQAGIENVVASSGTSLTEDQIRLISRFSNTITVLFDGDTAGLKASLRGIDMILEGGLDVKAVAFPDGEDPDSYARKFGSTAYQAFLNENAQDFISFKVGVLTQDATDDPIKKVETIREIVQSIARIPDSIKRSVYIKQCAELLSLDEQLLIEEQDKLLFKKEKERQRSNEFRENSSVSHPAVAEVKSKPNVQKRLPDAVRLQERETVRLLIVYGLNPIEEGAYLYQYLLEEVEDVNFETPIYQEIISLFKDHLDKGEGIDGDYLIRNSSEHIRQEVIDLLAERYEVSQNWKEKFQIYVPEEAEILNHVAFSNVLRLKLRVLQKLISENMQELKIALNDEEKQQDILQIHTALKNKEMEIARLLGIVVVR
ncbi:DNA primase [Xanthovirga aplysinae]|uniref:DNA primase n=1 Tax=Xanthovirga aplysinae TaxID=2529853 RepID=UPI0012BB680E|nr:DNA primase [Xanthovirga aplysinae]MTI33447.1 DNA primase [Xanthovirga aplysinae]